MTSRLTPQQLQQFGDLLRARRASLDQQRDHHLGGQTRAEHAREVLLQDGDDDTQRDAEREVDLARSDRNTIAAAEIDRALQRLAAGVYGLCTECGDDIALERLQMAPEAPRCVDCERLLERGRPRPPRL